MRTLTVADKDVDCEVEDETVKQVAHRCYLCSVVYSVLMSGIYLAEEWMKIFLTPLFLAACHNVNRFIAKLIRGLLR